MAELADETAYIDETTADVYFIAYVETFQQFTHSYDKSSHSSYSSNTKLPHANSHFSFKT